MIIKPFNTYYINMKNDIVRNKEVINELSKTNLKYYRFNAINGKLENRNDSKYKNNSFIFKKFATNKMFGTTNSHGLLYNLIKKNDKNEFALILEDDIIVTNPELDYNKEINKIVNYYNILNPKWEIIRLHSFLYGAGSAAAQIINLKYIDKLTKYELHYHNDFQQTFLNNCINLNYLFTTKDNSITYKNYLFNKYFDNQKIGFYASQHIINLFNFDILLKHVIYLVLFLILLNTLNNKIKYLLGFILYFVVITEINKHFILSNQQSFLKKYHLFYNEFLP